MSTPPPVSSTRCPGCRAMVVPATLPAGTAVFIDVGVPLYRLVLNAGNTSYRAEPSQRLVYPVHRCVRAA